MSDCDRNYFELCNDILGELYFDEVDTFDELEDIEEGRRAKRELNKALNFIYVVNSSFNNICFNVIS